MSSGRLLRAALVWGAVLHGCGNVAPGDAPPPPPGSTRGAADLCRLSGMPVDWSHARLGVARALAARCPGVDASPGALQALLRSRLPTLAPGARPPPDPAPPDPPDAAPPATSDGAIVEGPDAGPALDAGDAVDAGSVEGDAGPALPTLDWNLPTASGVAAPPALLIGSDTGPSAEDRIFFGLRASAGPNFFALDDLYAPAPHVRWQASIGGLDGSAVALDLEGKRVYALAKNGSLWCFEAQAGGPCPGWTAPSVATGEVVSGSSPWVDYASGGVYFATMGRGLFKVDGHTGALLWRVALPGATHGSPVAWAGRIWIGDDRGRIHVLTESPGQPAVIESTFNLCPSGSSACAIMGGVAIDLQVGRVFVLVRGVLHELDLATGQPTGSTALGTSESGTSWSSPTPDVDQQLLYVAAENALYQVPYPLVGSGFVYGARLQLENAADPSFPHASPLVFGGQVYLGSGGGTVEAYGCLQGGYAPVRVGVTPTYGVKVETTPLIDYWNGNILFGYENADRTGGLVQITQGSALWGCGSEGACATAGCGAGACKPAMACVPQGLPPSTFFASGGGGRGVQAGAELHLTFPPLGSTVLDIGRTTLTLGAIADEIF